MISNMRSDSQIKIFTPKSNFSNQIQHFKNDSSRNLESENNQQIMISNCMSNSINNLTPTKQNFTRTLRKTSINQQTRIRDDNMIISCYCCENLDNLNLIQPCLCDINYHASCFKQKLLNTPGQFSQENFTCTQCGIQYKVQQLEIYKSKTFINLFNIILFTSKLIITLGGLGGLSYWFYNYTQKQQEMSSLIAVIVLLILLFLLYLVYLIVEVFRGEPDFDWQVVDYKSEVEQQLNPEDLNLLENRSKQLSNDRPNTLHQITSVQYPQNNLNEIIN
ncbi:unnamed protein product (macronuclear) [Paramecium tetraurelia]|uniref:RING-CH-type domain-containing protein n=1 Tax=Paramecium tetraurelia TaxID=5888 RepID=A0D7P0_PARTE|nr:uncharacterized protein GSPATT00014024001 [Paramecium tetraurelia]CAK79057.1 unnamed protein product [Paramecium tetraurelia]|eukprot:XP_001446454.1 hypothetical protein (macronuclear) [Paramecium tetraurelia strain d4-2]